MWKKIYMYLRNCKPVYHNDYYLKHIETLKANNLYLQIFVTPARTSNVT